MLQSYSCLTAGVLPQCSQSPAPGGSVGPGTHPIFFFSSRRRHTRYIGDWSSDVCSSDLAEQARRAIETGETSLITKLAAGDLSCIDPYMIQQAARQKDALALHLWEQAGERLGIALASMVNIFNPEWIVLAGGLSRAGPLL